MVEALEKHYTPKELGELWGFSESTIRRMFEGVDGVLRFGTTTRRGRRGYVSVRIPASVAQAVHERQSRR